MLNMLLRVFAQKILDRSVFSNVDHEYGEELRKIVNEIFIFFG